MRASSIRMWEVAVKGELGCLYLGRKVQYRSLGDIVDRIEYEYTY